MRTFKEDTAAYHRNWYANNKEIRKRQVTRWRQQQLDLMRSLKKRPCMDCNIEYPPYVMQFDHLYDKKFSIASKARDTGIENLMKEISKCEVVCANCHAERTHRRRSTKAVQDFCKIEAESSTLSGGSKQLFLL